MSGKVGKEKIEINSNELVEKYIGGDVICLEDVVNEIINIGPNFNKITEFISPFKLTTPPHTLMSRIRKPVAKNGHWGYRGPDINTYIENMI
jgi:large subunit ribosomal protein L7e